MFLKNHFQNAYVTHDLPKAMKLIDDRVGETDRIVFEPDMALETPEARRNLKSRRLRREIKERGFPFCSKARCLA